MSRKIEDILDECLHLMAQGRTVEECLSSFPEQAAELEPLLRTAVFGQRAMVLPQPSPTARAAGRQDMLTALAARRKRPRRLLPLRGWALALASLVIAVIVSSGTVVASFQSVPEETLYPVKRAVERVQLALSTSPVSEARTLVRQSDNRLSEIEVLEGKGKVQATEKLRKRMNKQLKKAADLAIDIERRGGDGRVVIAAMERNLARHRARLYGGKVAAVSMPGQAKGRIEGAIPTAPMAQSGSAASPSPLPQREEAALDKGPSPVAVPAPRPAGAPVPAAAPSPHPAKAPPGLKRQLREPSPQARRALQKALDDYQQALELLKARIERIHQERQQPDR